MARPRLLDEVKCGQVAALLSSGCSLKVAARYVGCSTRTIHREVFRNPEFGDQLRQAETVRQVGPLRALRRAAESNWRAAAWLLERGDPDQFARRNPAHATIVEVEELFCQVIDVVVRIVRDPDERRQIARAFDSLFAQADQERRSQGRPFRDASARNRRRPPGRAPRTAPPPGSDFDAPTAGHDAATDAAEFGTPQAAKYDFTPGTSFLFPSERRAPSDPPAPDRSATETSPPAPVFDKSP